VRAASIALKLGLKKGQVSPSVPQRVTRMGVSRMSVVKADATCAADRPEALRAHAGSTHATPRARQRTQAHQAGSGSAARPGTPAQQSCHTATAAAAPCGGSSSGSSSGGSPPQQLQLARRDVQAPACARRHSQQQPLLADDVRGDEEEPPKPQLLLLLLLLRSRAAVVIAATGVLMVLMVHTAPRLLLRTVLPASCLRPLVRAGTPSNSVAVVTSYTRLHGKQRVIIIPGVICRDDCCCCCC
jgi:hypothetical protein